MILHLVELPIAMRALHHWAGRRLPSPDLDEGVALHHLLAETFGPAVLQPFRLMVAPRARDGSLYAYAAVDAETLRNTARASLTPDLAAVIRLDQLRSIPRPFATWQEGQQLGFDLRLRPVVRLASDLHGKDDHGASVNFRKGAEIDAFLSEVLRGRSASREGVYLRWLADRLSPAATLDHSASRLARFERARILRDGRMVDGPDAVIHGTLTIGDPEAFATVLAKGVGRHRSYGYGMLLLRPAQKPR